MCVLCVTCCAFFTVSVRGFLQKARKAPPIITLFACDYLMYKYVCWSSPNRTPAAISVVRGSCTVVVAAVLVAGQRRLRCGHNKIAATTNEERRALSELFPARAPQVIPLSE